MTVFAGYGIGFDILDPLERGEFAAGDASVIEAPMPGMVKAVFAEAGQEVAKGDRLAVLEAMKMEHSLLAPRDGGGRGAGRCGPPCRGRGRADPAGGGRGGGGVRDGLWLTGCRFGVYTRGVRMGLAPKGGA